LKQFFVHKWQGLPKLAAVMGGFLIIVGVIQLGIAVLAVSGFLNVGLMLERKYLLMFAFAIILVGLLDTFSAIIIARW